MILWICATQKICSIIRKITWTSEFVNSFKYGSEWLRWTNLPIFFYVVLQVSSLIIHCYQVSDLRISSINARSLFSSCCFMRMSLQHRDSWNRLLFLLIRSWKIFYILHVNINYCLFSAKRKCFSSLERILLIISLVFKRSL